MRIALIPARGNSVRIPNKNVRAFRGLSMICYPLRAAKASGLFDLVVVSTDDYDIAYRAFKEGATVVPRETDDGTTGTQEIAARVLDALDIASGACCVLYPCTPLLTPDDIKAGWSSLLAPYLTRCFTRAVGPNGQDAGAMYWGWTRAFRDRKPLDAYNTTDVYLPAERVCDINTPDDWATAETMFDAQRIAANGGTVVGLTAHSREELASLSRLSFDHQRDALRRAS